MPKFNVIRSYTVASVATIEADNADDASLKAVRSIGSDDIHWKEYEGNYDSEVTVMRCDDD